MQMFLKSELVLIKRKCEEFYVVMNSVNDIKAMLLTVFLVVLYCCACRREFQFLPGCFFLAVVHVSIRLRYNFVNALLSLNFILSGS